MSPRGAVPVRAILSLAVLALAAGSPARAQPQAPGADGRYMVEFHSFGPDAAAIVRGAGGVPVYEFPQYNVIAAWLPAGAAQALARNPNVRSIAEDVRRYPLSQTVPYGISMVQADLFSEGPHAAGRKVCIIDSGYYTGHEDLPTGPVTGTNNSGTGNWFQDACGHGTHVAGTIAALDNDKGVAGVVPRGTVGLHIVKVFGDNCTWTYSSNLINALNTCRDNGANIVSMSLGGGKAIGPWEERAFNDAYNAGVLSVAAAGNSGGTSLFYPASYDSVVSVGALDENKVVADFSQKNSQVELTAPGVGVLSTVPYLETNTLTVDGVTYQGNHIEFSARGTASGTLANGGRCTSTNGAWSGRVVLCERGDISFFDKVRNVQNSGGVAAVIYNNEPGNFFGTLGAGNSSTIPAISLSQQDGQWLAANKIGAAGTVVSTSQAPASGYEAWNGTSMATPHVSGVAALVWSQNQGWTNAQIRGAMQATAEDLGPAGRDNAYGYGLVQAKAALCYLAPNHAVCDGGPVNNPPTASFTYSCTDLTCTFADTSTDSDGSVVDWSWDFGDGNTATAQHATHTYASGGTRTVTLTVTDDGGATGSTSQSVTATAPGEEGIVLSATGYKERGLQKADLQWTGATSTNVDIFRNNTPIATVANSGAYTDDINNRGGGGYTYRVCEVGTSTCSNEVTVTF
jgi:serine protease